MFAKGVFASGGDAVYEDDPAIFLPASTRLLFCGEDNNRWTVVLSRGVGGGGRASRGSFWKRSVGEAARSRGPNTSV